MKTSNEMIDTIRKPNAVVIDRHLRPITNIKYVMVHRDTISLVTFAGIVVYARAIGWTALVKENEEGIANSE